MKYKLTIETDDQEELNLAANYTHAYQALWELKQELRKMWKHEETLADADYQRLLDIYHEHNIDMG